MQRAVFLLLCVVLVRCKAVQESPQVESGKVEQVRISQSPVGGTVIITDYATVVANRVDKDSSFALALSAKSAVAKNLHVWASNALADEYVQLLDTAQKVKTSMVSPSISGVRVVIDTDTGRIVCKFFTSFERYSEGVVVTCGSEK